jgi:hypothetical protein
MSFASLTNKTANLSNTVGNFFKTSAAATFITGAKTSYIFPVLAGIVGIAIIASIIIAIVSSAKGSPTNKLKGPVDLFKPASPVLIDRTSVTKSMKGTYTFSFYLMVTAVPDMRTAATPLLTWPGAWNINYNPSQEQLQFVFQQTQDSGNPAPAETITLDHVPPQKWTQVTMVFEGRTADLFVNGKLLKSDSLNNVPPASTASITIVPGAIHGQVAYVQLWPSRQRIGDVAANYTATSDSQGRPLISPGFFKPLGNISMFNPFCSGGDCGGSKPTATPSQTWEFPYQ